jgi:hypothetical protein
LLDSPSESDSVCRAHSRKGPNSSAYLHVPSRVASESPEGTRYREGSSQFTSSAPRKGSVPFRFGSVYIARSSESARSTRHRLGSVQFAPWGSAVPNSLAVSSHAFRNAKFLSRQFPCSPLCQIPQPSVLWESAVPNSAAVSAVGVRSAKFLG